MAVKFWAVGATKNKARITILISRHAVGARQNWAKIKIVEVPRPQALENSTNPIKTEKVVGNLEMEKVTESDDRGGRGGRGWGKVTSRGVKI